MIDFSLLKEKPSFYFICCLLDFKLKSEVPVPIYSKVRVKVPKMGTKVLDLGPGPSTQATEQEEGSQQPIK